jgi:hypothetical protein
VLPQRSSICESMCSSPPFLLFFIISSFLHSLFHIPILCASLCPWLHQSVCLLPFGVSSGSWPLAPGNHVKSQCGVISGPDHYLGHWWPLLSENVNPTLEGNQVCTCVQVKEDQNCSLGLEGTRTQAHPLFQFSEPTSAVQTSWDIGQSGVTIQSRDSERCGRRESRRWILRPNGVINAN